MVVVVFRSTLRDDLTADLLNTLIGHSARMFELATQSEGFISYKQFNAEDGEMVSIVEFESEAHSRAWGEHPEHQQVQQWARHHAFADYRVTVCEPLRESSSSQD